MPKLNVKTVAPENEVKKSVNGLPKEVTIKDERGRDIVVTKPSYLRKLKLLATLGDDLASNRAYMREVSLITWVTSIDGIAVYQPNTLNEVEVIVNRLEEDGFNAAIRGILQIQGIDIDAALSAEAEDQQEGEKSLAKK